MIYLAVAVGLGGAFSQSLSYIFSRSFLCVKGRNVQQLMALAHLLMAGISLALLPLVWITPAADWEEVIRPLASCAGADFVGQVGFFFTITYSTYSWVFVNCML